MFQHLTCEALQLMRFQLFSMGSPCIVLRCVCVQRLLLIKPSLFRIAVATRKSVKFHAIFDRVACFAFRVTVFTSPYFFARVYTQLMLLTSGEIQQKCEFVICQNNLEVIWFSARQPWRISRKILYRLNYITLQHLLLISVNNFNVSVQL